MALTKVSGPLLHGSNDNLGNYVINNITGAAATFSSVSVGGTLTYDDVTNVDSVGIVTARGGLHVGAGGTIIYALSEDNGNVGIGTTDASHQITVYAKSANSVLARFKAVNRNSNFDIFTDGSSNGQANVKNNVGATKVKLNSVGDSYFTGGDVGIGTDSPDGKLDVRGTIFVNGDATGGRIFASGGNLSLTDGNGRQTLRIDDPGSGNTHTHVFDSNGRLGIGTTNPQDSAHVQHFQSSVRHQSFQSTNGDLAIVTDNNSNPALYIKGTGTADLVNVFDNTDEVFTIKDGGKFGFNDDDKLYWWSDNGSGTQGDATTAAVFRDVLYNSVFALSPRGFGPASFRMYEAIQMQCIPIYVSDVMWLPFTNYIEWDKMCLLINPDEIELG